jgi:hypothetical protein
LIVMLELTLAGIAFFEPDAVTMGFQEQSRRYELMAAILGRAARHVQAAL